MHVPSRKSISLRVHAEPKVAYHGTAEVSRSRAFPIRYDLMCSVDRFLLSLACPAWIYAARLQYVIFIPQCLIHVFEVKTGMYKHDNSSDDVICPPYHIPCEILAVVPNRAERKG